MLSLAKIISFLALATFLPITLGVDTLAGAPGLARAGGEVGDYADGLIVDGMKFAGRQAVATITVTSTVISTVPASDCGSPSGTVTKTESTIVATETNMTTLPSGPAPGDSTTMPPMSNMSNTIPASSSEASSPPAPAAPTSSPPATTAPAASASSGTSSIITDSFSASASSISVPLTPTESHSTTSPSATHTIGNTNGAGLTKFNVIGSLAAIGAAALAVY